METTSAAGIQDQFLTLLTTQLRHQDPLEPTKQEDFIAQLAQFSTLEGIEELNENFSSFAETQAQSQDSSTQVFQQLASVAGLVGKQITYSQLDSAGNTEQGAGVVEAVVRQDDAVHLRIANESQLIRLDQLQEIGPVALQSNDANSTELENNLRSRFF